VSFEALLRAAIQESPSPVATAGFRIPARSGLNIRLGHIETVKRQSA
jgi:hypothetical protein